MGKWGWSEEPRQLCTGGARVGQRCQTACWLGQQGRAPEHIEQREQACRSLPLRPTCGSPPRRVSAAMWPHYAPLVVQHPKQRGSVWEIGSQSLGVPQAPWRLERSPSRSLSQAHVCLPEPAGQPRDQSSPANPDSPACQPQLRGKLHVTAPPSVLGGTFQVRPKQAGGGRQACPLGADSRH